MRIQRHSYTQLAQRKPPPYCFAIKKRSQVLYYFGANHSRDPQNEQYPVLCKYWSAFLKTANPNKLVMVEGALRKIERSDSLAIRLGSEGSLITILAQREHIPVTCPEPVQGEVLASLRERFAEEEIQYYRFAGLVNSWHRYRVRPNFERWMRGMMRRFSKRNNFEMFTLARMKAIHHRIFKQRFSYHKERFFSSIIDPNKTTTIINRVARTASDLRDVQIIRKIQREWRSGKSLFVVYGCGHAYLQEGILRKTLK